MSRILFIDDDGMILKMGSFIAKKGGNEALTASLGEEGIEILRNEHPDIVFIDSQMPKMSGIETLSEIRKDSSISDVRVCLMSGTIDDELKAAAEQLGAVGIIGKPLKADEINKIIGS